MPPLVVNVGEGVIIAVVNAVGWCLVGSRWWPLEVVGAVPGLGGRVLTRGEAEALFARFGRPGAKS